MCWDGHETFGIEAERHCDSGEGAGGYMLDFANRVEIVAELDRIRY